MTLEGFILCIFTYCLYFLTTMFRVPCWKYEKANWINGETSLLFAPKEILIDMRRRNRSLP